MPKRSFQAPAWRSLFAFAVVSSLASANAVAVAGAGKLSVRDIVIALKAASPKSPVNFEGLDLQSLDLSQLDFKSARLEASNLFGADLTDADLRQTKLQKSILNRATLTRANFHRADLSNATLLRPSIHTTLEPNPLEAPNFREALLTKVRFQGRFDGTDFGAANLKDAYFGERSTLVRCEFSGSDLQHAVFDWTDLTYARFQSAKLDAAHAPHGGRPR